MKPAQAYSFPNSHHAHLGEMLSPLIADRVCELSVECCHLRNDISDEQDKNCRLLSDVRRLQTAVKRGSNTLKEEQEENKNLRVEKTELQEALVATQKILMQAESRVCFQAKVIENNRKVIEKLKTPITNKESDGKVGKNVAQVLRKNAELEEALENLQQEFFAEKARSDEKTRLIRRYEDETAQFQSRIKTLQNKLNIVQGDLRSEKAIVSQLREKNKQDDLGELSYTKAFIDLEEAYEELHTKYELLWAERDSVAESLSNLRHERNRIYEAAKRAGVRVDTLLIDNDILKL